MTKQIRTTDLCVFCGGPCQAVSVDNGIGAYEYWGSKEVHHDWTVGSSCCGGDVVEGGYSEALIRDTQHTARKNHADGKVKKGDRYQVKVWRHWRTDENRRWMTVKKTVLDTFREAVKEAL